MPTWSGVGEEILKTAQPFVRQGIDFIPVIPDSAVMQLATTFTEALEAHGIPFAKVCELLELESESAEHEELLGKS
jgi:hypothetical protein